MFNVALNVYYIVQICSYSQRSEQIDKQTSNAANMSLTLSPTQSEHMPRMGDMSTALDIHLLICSFR